MVRSLAVRFLKALPELHLAVLVPSLTIAVFVKDEFTTILSVGVGVLWGLILTSVAILCMVITVAKGPVRRKDGGAA